MVNGASRRWRRLSRERPKLLLFHAEQDGTGRLVRRPHPGAELTQVLIDVDDVSLDGPASRWVIPCVVQSHPPPATLFRAADLAPCHSSGCAACTAHFLERPSPPGSKVKGRDGSRCPVHRRWKPAGGTT